MNIIGIVFLGAIVLIGVISTIAFVKEWMAAKNKEELYRKNKDLFKGVSGSELFGSMSDNKQRMKDFMSSEIKEEKK